MKWLLNILPPAIILWFFHSMSPAEILSSLGFGAGVALTVAVLTIFFLKEKIFGGFVLNFLLLGFVFISYYLPQIDIKGDTFFLVMIAVMTPVMQAMMCLSLVMYLEEKPADPFDSKSSLANYYFRPPLYFGFIGMIIGLPLQHAGILKFSTALAGGQLLAWLFICIALYVLGLPARMDFAALRTYIQEKQLQLSLRQNTAVYAFLAFLLVCTLFEAFRGFWRLWTLTGLWGVFMFASLWRVWSYAFQPGEGPGWHYFEALGNYMERIRATSKPAEVKKEAQISNFARSHATIGTILVLLLVAVLFFSNINPIILIILLFGFSLLFNYFLKEILKNQGITLEGKIPLSVGMTFIMTTIAMFFFLYILLFVIKQIIWG